MLGGLGTRRASGPTRFRPPARERRRTSSPVCSRDLLDVGPQTIVPASESELVRTLAQLHVRGNGGNLFPRDPHDPAAADPGCTDWRAVRPVPGKLFLVGDPKQSIYRFRRADVALYEEVKQCLLRVGAELLYLTTSFRSPPSIQSFVNGVFAPAIAAGSDASQAAYVPLQPSRPEVAGQPTIVALPVPKPYGD